MSHNNGIKKLKAAIAFSVLVNVVYGIAFFIAPGIMSVLAGGTPVETGWLRWSGGILLGLAAGGIHAYRDPVHQKSMITTMILAPFCSGLAFLYTLLAETYSVHTWFIVVPCIVVFAMSGVMLWARQVAKEVLV
ncbi:MAG: hypothetical protein ACHQ0Y_11455 [Thermodesulfovibrionales bacterium]